jgi:hypothetical protein
LGDVVLEALRERFGGRVGAATARTRIVRGRVRVAGVVVRDPVLLVDPGEVDAS